jgi:hypothetical protein
MNIVNLSILHIVYLADRLDIRMERNPENDPLGNDLVSTYS